MSQHDLERVRNDLDTIQAAIGLQPPQSSKEIRINLSFAGAGLAAIAWSLVATGPIQLAAFAFFLVPFADWLRTAASCNSHEFYLRRDLRDAFRTVFLALPLVALFIWCRSVGLAPVHFLSLSVFCVGVALFSGAVGSRSEPSYICWSITLMTGGLFVSLGVASPVLVLSGALGLGGLSSALVLYFTQFNSQNYAAN
jgi:hypothetical protein